jgi:hypothetical protein
MDRSNHLINVTLQNLTEFHEIEFEIIDGVYYNDGFTPDH